MSTDESTPSPKLPIKYRDVMLALSKACAARALAIIATADPPQITGPEEREWILGFAFDALGDALGEAEEAYRKEHGELAKDEDA